MEKHLHCTNNPKNVLYFIMATIRASRSFVLFTLLLADQGYINIFEDLLSLRFNVRI